MAITIKVNQETKRLLDNYRNVEEDSYDATLNRLLDEIQLI